MKPNTLDYKNFINKLDSSSGKMVKVPITKEERIKLIKRVNKLPGEMGLDERTLLIIEQALNFTKLDSYRPDLVKGTKDWVSYWNKEKELNYTGILIDEEFYFTSDHYFYLNYTPIPDKVKGIITFPRIFDTDIWFYQHIELAELNFNFTVTPKKRQIGVTLKLLSKIFKRFWFEKGFSGKIAAWDEKYVKEGWKLLEIYRDHVHSNTPWKRPIIGGRLDWTQAQLLKDGTRIGLLSALKGITFKNNPAAIVSGKTDEVFADELGIAPNADEMLEFLRPALQFGNIITGNFHGAGAVGRLKDCKPLKEWSFNPEENNFHSVPNTYADKPMERVSMFIPEEWSYGSYMDKYGNSDVEGAKKKIKELAEKEKSKSFRAYMLYKSQRPSSLEEAFASRENNIYPTHLIQPHYDYISEKYKPLDVDIIDGEKGLFHKIGAKFPIIDEFPVNRKTIKEGAIVIEEAPLKNAPFGLYYAGVDTITPIKSESISLQCIYIYKASHQINDEYYKDKLVAWYAGRTEDPYNAYRNCRDLIQYYNARALIENNNRNFIEWMINEKQQKYMMKRNEVPIGKDLIMKATTDTSDYGINVTRIKEYLTSLSIAYVEEKIETKFDNNTGKPIDIYGVERIKDKMLLEEMLNYTPSKNTDRIDAFCLALLAAKTSTSRGIIVKTSHEYGKIEKKPVNYRDTLSKTILSNKRRGLNKSRLRNNLRW